MGFVTTTRSPREEYNFWARKFSEEIRFLKVDRKDRSLRQLFQETGEEEAIIVGSKTWWQNLKGETFFFHPNMSLMRIRQLMKGKTDALVAVSQMKAKDTVLDCTLGLGSDAIVASHVCGDQGSVVGLESEAVLAAMVKHGLKNYASPFQPLKQAMDRVQVKQVDYRFFLKHSASDAFDIICFDPMFQRTLPKSRPMQSLKALANPDPLDRSSVEEAVRVARRCVVLKERKGSSLFEKLGFKIVKEQSHHAFGIIFVK